MEKIWLKHYPEHVPAEIELDRYQSVKDMFNQSVAKYPDRVAFSNMGKQMRYDELSQRTREFAGFLQCHLQCQQGDRIAIMLPNLLQSPIATFGALRAGLTVVNVNPLYMPRELKHQLQDSGAETIVILSHFADTLEEVVADTPIKNIVITDVGDMLGFPKSKMDW